MAALWTVEYVGGAIHVRRHRSQADAEAYRIRFCVAMAGF